MLSADITPAELTVADGSAANKPYDGTTDAVVDFTAASLVGVVGTEDVTLDATAATGAFVSADAGDDIDVTSTASPWAAAPTSATTPSPSRCSAPTSPQAELTVADGSAANKPYDGTTDAIVDSHSASLVGVVST